MLHSSTCMAVNLCQNHAPCLVMVVFLFSLFRSFACCGAIFLGLLLQLSINVDPSCAKIYTYYRNIIINQATITVVCQKIQVTNGEPSFRSIASLSSFDKLRERTGPPGSLDRRSARRSASLRENQTILLMIDRIIAAGFNKRTGDLRLAW